MPKFTPLCFRIRHYKDVVFVRSDYSIFMFIIIIKEATSHSRARLLSYIFGIVDEG